MLYFEHIPMIGYLLDLGAGIHHLSLSVHWLWNLMQPVTNLLNELQCNCAIRQNWTAHLFRKVFSLGDFDGAITRIDSPRWREVVSPYQRLSVGSMTTCRKLLKNRYTVNKV